MKEKITFQDKFYQKRDKWLEERGRKVGDIIQDEDGFEFVWEICDEEKRKRFLPKEITIGYYEECKNEAKRITKHND